MARHVWSDVDIERLRAFVAEGLDDADIGRALGRPASAIQKKRERLRIMFLRQWTADEVAQLLELAGQGCDDEQISASMPGRTVRAVTIKRNELRVVRYHRDTRAPVSDTARRKLAEAREYLEIMIRFARANREPEIVELAREALERTA